MVNYENGKIYTIRSYKTDLVYVGSTTQPLSKRLHEHKKGHNEWMKNSKKYVSSFEIFKLDDGPYIELVKNHPCSCRDELIKEEGKYIRKIKCVNKRVEGRTYKERCEDNKEKMKEYRKEYYNLNKEYHKEYYEDNKEKMKEYRKEYYEDNKEKMKEYHKEYYEDNKEKMKEKLEEYREKNKEILKQKASQKVKCPQCDKEMRRDSVKKHIQRKHK